MHSRSQSLEWHHHHAHGGLNRRSGSHKHLSKNNDVTSPSKGLPSIQEQVEQERERFHVSFASMATKRNLYNRLSLNSKTHLHKQVRLKLKRYTSLPFNSKSRLCNPKNVVVSIQMNFRTQMIFFV